MVQNRQEEFSRPAYVVEARHGALTGITLGSMVRGLAERGAVWGPLKRQRQREIHPPETWRGDFAQSISGWWFEPFFIFPLILGIIIPIDFHIFQRGGPTTNQICPKHF